MGAGFSSGSGSAIRPRRGASISATPCRGGPSCASTAAASSSATAPSRGRSSRTTAELGRVADVPDHLTLRHNRDREGRARPLIRRAFVGVLVADLRARPRERVRSASVDLHGGHDRRRRSRCTHRLASAPASTTWRASRSTRAGTADARPWCSTPAGPRGSRSTRWTRRRSARRATTAGSSSSSARSRPAKYVLFIHLQVNPTNVGHRSQDVELRDGDTALAHIDRTITVFP